MSMDNLNPHGHDRSVRATEEARRRSAAARLFDIRRVIGGLFTAYGAIVTLIGIFDSGSAVQKAQGVRTNLLGGPRHARLRRADAALAVAQPGRAAGDLRGGALSRPAAGIRHGHRHAGYASGIRRHHLVTGGQRHDGS